MSTTPDFSGLTAHQRAVLDAGGWQLGRGKQPARGTVRKLLQRGLVIARPRRVMAAVVDEYEVPAHVAAAWQATTTPQPAAAC
ncbi:MAG TPA: hypothetical protein VNV16_12500 [Methylibium sp.]|nr:hypothetical protein [Methylibium sp.]